MGYNSESKNISNPKEFLDQKCLGQKKKNLAQKLFGEQNYWVQN